MMKKINCREEKMIDALVSEICAGDSASNAAEPAMMIVAAPDDDRADLAKYNQLIAAIKAMDGVRIDDQILGNQLHDICDALKGERSRMFEHLVDWDAIAGGAKKDE